MTFKSDNTKTEFYIYISLILFFVIFGMFLVIEFINGSDEALYKQISALVFVTVMPIILIGQFKEAFFVITFEEKGFRYKCKFFKEKFIYYEDVKDLKVIKSRVTSYYMYVIKVVPYKGSSAKFNVTNAIKTGEQYKFVKEMEKRVGMKAELRKGSFFVDSGDMKGDMTYPNGKSDDDLPVADKNGYKKEKWNIN